MIQANNVSKDGLLYGLPSPESGDIDYAMETLMKRKCVIQSQDRQFILEKTQYNKPQAMDLSAQDALMRRAKPILLGSMPLEK